MGCHSLLQGIFPTQELNPGFPHCRQILYRVATREAPNAYPSMMNTLLPQTAPKWEIPVLGHTKSWKYFFRIPRKLSFSFTYYENKHSISYNCTIKKEWCFTAFMPFITDPCKSSPMNYFYRWGTESQRSKSINAGLEFKPRFAHLQKPHILTYRMVATRALWTLEVDLVNSKILWTDLC